MNHNDNDSDSAWDLLFGLVIAVVVILAAQVFSILTH